MNDDFRIKFDAKGHPMVVNPEFATKVHLGRDPLDPFYSITVKADGPNSRSFDGLRSRQDFFDVTLPEWMRK